MGVWNVAGRTVLSCHTAVYSLVQWNWFSVVTGCTWIARISDVREPISLCQAVHTTTFCSSGKIATQSSHSVDRAGWQAKMASIEFWIPWRDAHKHHWASLRNALMWSKLSMAVLPLQGPAGTDGRPGRKGPTVSVGVNWESNINRKVREPHAFPTNPTHTRHFTPKTLSLSLSLSLSLDVPRGLKERPLLLSHNVYCACVNWSIASLHSKTGFFELMMTY